MTLAMPDSITVADLPPGYPAYLGYADGTWPTAAELAKKFPAAKRVILTVTGGTLDADGIDCEPGNPDAASSAGWAGRKLQADPGFRPVIYASVIGQAGYGMHDVLAHLFTLRIPLPQVRLHTAHYDWQGTGADPANKHLCGPATCRLLPVDADATQWTDVYPGANHGTLIDMSVLRDDFFKEAPAMGTVIPGIPGTWLSFTQFYDSARDTASVVGIGTDGRVYWTQRVGSGAWSTVKLLGA